jgi:hypothetical protein
MRKTFHGRWMLLLGPALFATSVPTGALAFQDVITGLRVEPPAPLTAEKISNINFAGAIGIRSPQGSPQPAAPNEFLCQVGFVPRPVDGTQQEINAATLEPGSLEEMSASLGGAFASYESATFTANGVSGFEFYATPNEAADSRLYTTLLQTPAGMVQQHCTTTAADADAALVLFRAIRDSVVPP